MNLLKKDNFQRDVFLGLLVWFMLIIFYYILPDPGIHDIIQKVFILGLFAMSLNILIGYLGLIAFGHAAFFASGAYTLGLFLQSDFVLNLAGFSIPVAIVLAVLVSSILATLIGVICIRLKDIYFSFLTLAFQMLIYSIILALVNITGGDQGLMGGFPKPPFLGIDLGKPFDFYAFTIFISIITIVLLRQLIESPFGYGLRMIRDNSERPAALGFNNQKHKLIAFIIAGSIAGLAGSLQALLDVGAYPEWAFWSKSAEPLFMILLGGMHSFLGPLMGALIFEILNDFVTANTRYYGLVLGLVILCFVLGLKKGLLDWLLIKLNRK
ncbi:MAG TPA: branched-chain amino acid ABC transporter permease [Alphaproteobacteria bacterium]|jgi:branched-chain amino acid transport system permease protein|nr:branched-chain amino acid ABC transporter permease [Alphaproteobacteria bacterium]HIK87063.1 branched-chain amino acid ABC transporter permease [Alphaproteobacteria bacterium]